MRDTEHHDTQTAGAQAGPSGSDGDGPLEVMAVAVAGDGIDRGIYEMPGFVTFTVADLALSQRWYTEGLGFVVLAELPGPGGQTVLAHLRRHRYQDILLVSGSGQGQTQPGGGGGVRYTVSAGSEDLAVRGASAPAVGSGSVHGPGRTPWNTVDLVCRDPDGHQVVLTQRADSAEADEQFSATVRASVRT